MDTDEPQEKRSAFNKALDVPRDVFRSTVMAIKDFNFIQIHYIYFIGASLFSGLIFWGAATPFGSVSFTDSLFLTTSAMTLAGLNTVNLSTLNTFQQFMLFVLIMMGSTVFVSAFVVYFRRHAFEDRFLSEIDLERRLKRRKTLLPLSRTLTRAKTFSRSVTQQRDPDTNKLNGTAIPNDVEKEEAVRGRSPSRAAEDDANAPASNAASGTTQGADALRERQPNLTLNTDDSHETQSMPEIRKEDTQQSVMRSPISENRIKFDSDLARPKRPDPNVPDEHGHSVIHHLLPRNGVGARGGLRARSTSVASAATSRIEPRFRTKPDKFEDDPEMHHHFFTSGVLARNSTFHHMSEDDRERLGGIEYRAVRYLSYLVPAYFILWQLIGCIGLGAYVALNRPAAARENGMNPWWVGAFNAVSAFNNSGMSLLDANMVAFQTSVYMLISMGLFILAGNTCYPVFLRWIIWTMWRLCPSQSTGRINDFKCTLRFMLDHPRRVYTNLFPGRETWWLFATVIVLNCVDCAFFAILNIGNKAITHLDPGIEFLDGLFQAFAVRSGGFYVVPIPSTRISLQVLYVVMMYISVYPVVITIRNSNVYEERSLGIYSDDPGYQDYERQEKQRRRSIFATLMGHATTVRKAVPVPSAPNANANGEGRHKHENAYFVLQQLRAQLAHDLWWLVLAVWLIMIIEGGQFEKNPAFFSVFNVLFEVVSGYGTVGISVGVPYDAFSFCGSWHVLSKLILCAVMIRGRHRGLPVAIDKAVMLPRDAKIEANMEEEDARLRWEKAKVKGKAEEERA